jgi:ATP synthase protein I
MRRLRREVDRQSRRMRDAERDRPTLMAQTVFLGTLGLLFVLPVVGGAYLGHWLDEQRAGYSTAWTLGLLLTGIALGLVNVYAFVRERK